MTYINHVNNANNFDVITSYEFSDIISYLTAKEKAPSQVLPIMKGFNSIRKVKNNHFVVDQNEAWLYFSKEYSKSMTTKRIRDMDDLLHSAEDYVEKHRLF